MKKLLALNLLLLIGTSQALNTGNVLDPNPTDGFLDGIYDYPNIHSHSPTDPVIFTGSPSHLNKTDELVKVSDYVGEDQLMSGINWSVDYMSVVDATIYAGVVLYDANSNSLDSEVGSYDVGAAGNNYVTISGIYSNPLILPDVEFISFTIGGISDRGGTDDIRLTNPTLSIDYHDKVADEILEEIINDIIDNGGEVMKVEEIQLEPLMEIVEEVAEEVVEEVVKVVETVEVAEVVVEVKEETKAEVKTVAVVAPKVQAKTVVKPATKVVAKKSVKKQVKKVVKKTVKKQVKKTIKKSIVVIAKTTTAKQDVQVGEATTDALQTLNLIKSITVMTQVALVDTVDISSYTGITLSESVELEDNDDWYQDQAFYSSIGMTDSGILNGYNSVKINDNREWYGSNNQFY